GTHVAIAVMGGIDLDLRHAEIVGHELHITAFAFWGGINIIVPEGIVVDVTAVPLLGGVGTNLADDVPALPGAPVVRVRAIAIIGGVDIKAKARKRRVVGPLPEPPAPPLPPMPPGPPSLPR